MLEILKILKNVMIEISPPFAPPTTGVFFPENFYLIYITVETDCKFYDKFKLICSPCRSFSSVAASTSCRDMIRNPPPGISSPQQSQPV